MATWQDLIPPRLGDLPLGGDLIRTDPGGRLDAEIAILGVYPAATRWEHYKTADGPIKVPVAIEARSFDGSKSATELDATYFKALHLTRQDVVIIDMMPYYLANTSGSGRDGRSMWDNVQTYERLSGKKTAVSPRPRPDALVGEARHMPGNTDRLREHIHGHRRRLLITLGNEAAAFVRGDTVADDAQEHLLGELREMDVLGTPLDVVHLPHPGIVMKNEGWRQRLEKWCKESGRVVAAGSNTVVH